MSVDDDERGLLVRILSRSRNYSQQDMEAVSHWTKQLTALGCGIVYGTMPMTGLNAMMAFSLFNFAHSWIMISIVLRAKLEFEAQFELMKEGFVCANALFFLTWIVTFTLVHGS